MDYQNKGVREEGIEDYVDSETDEECEDEDRPDYSDSAQPCLVTFTSHVVSSDILSVPDQHEADHQDPEQDVQGGESEEVANYVLG